MFKHLAVQEEEVTQEGPQMMCHKPILVQEEQEGTVQVVVMVVMV